jgi:hypothetical protein
MTKISKASAPNVQDAGPAAEAGTEFLQLRRRDQLAVTATATKASAQRAMEGA